MAVVITGNNTPTAGGVTYGDGTTYANTAAGTAGQVLTSAGSSAPTWATPATGALVFISSQTVSTAVASIDFTSGISSTYDDYQIIFENMTSSSATARLQYYLYQSGSFSTSYSVISTADVDGSITNFYVDSNSLYIGNNGSLSTITTTVWGGNLMLRNVNSATARRPSLTGTVVSLGNSNAQASLQQIAGASNTAAVVTGFRFAYSGGNIATGTVRLYGISKS